MTRLPAQRAGRLAAIGAVATVAALMTVTAPSHADGANPMDRIRAAARTASYHGVVTVRWLDRAGIHATQLQVSAGNGVVRLDGASKTAATATQRWLFRDGDWDLVSPAGVSEASVPLAAKYAWTTAAGPMVAGRSTDIIELTNGGHLEERLYLDHDTGLLLQRQQFDAAGTQIRSVGFDSISIAPDTPAAPKAAVDKRPRAATSAAAKTPYVAPAALPGGYQRVGVYRQDKTLQVVYSDGMHGLSMFEQPGKLDSGAIPDGGQRVSVGPRTGVTYVYPGGQVVVWQAGASTYTVVGDGPPDDVLLAAAAVPVSQSSSLSLLGRLRKACRDAITALTAR